MASRAREAVAAAAVVAAGILALSGCGSDDPGAPSATHGEGTPATATGGAVLPPTVSQSTTTPPPVTTTPPPTTTTTSPEDQQGGAGDEQAAVVPADFTLVGTEARPASIEVPAFFTIRVSATAADGKDHTLVFRGRTIEIPAGQRASARFKGLKAGTYPVTIDGTKGAAAIIVSKDAAGP